MIKFINTDCKPFLRMYDFVKDYDDVVRTVYFKLIFGESLASGSNKMESEETDFLDMRDILLTSLHTSKEVHPLIFRPMLSPNLELFIERHESNYKVNARLYDDTYKEFEPLDWVMDRIGIEAVINQISDVFFTKNKKEKI